MSVFQQRNAEHAKKKEKKQSEETKQGSESDSDDRCFRMITEFKITVINTLKPLIEKVNNIQKQKNDVKRETDTKK